MNSTYQDKKALVIDNSSIITKIIKNFLVQAGFNRNNIFCAQARNQAMMMFDLEKFDLVTSGIHLKDSTGFDLLKEIRENTNSGQSNIPFLIISAEEKNCHIDELANHQPSGYLRKPFDQDQFKEMVSSLINCTESATEQDSVSASTSTKWKKSPVEIPSSIIEAFSDSTIEAMEQYMAEAIPKKSDGSVELNGYFSAFVDLLNTEKRIQITLLLNFPKDVACGIYEGIFGEVDIEQVCGVVQELANIIGGIVKPRISGYSKDIIKLANPEDGSANEDVELTWDLGLPETKMGDNHTLDLGINGVPKFHIPFEVKNEIFHLVVLIQKY